MSRWIRPLLLIVALVAAAQWWSDRQSTPTGAVSPDATGSPATVGSADSDPRRPPGFLPPEAVATLAAIEQGGPFPYDRDGSIFQNRERRLPERPRGYYREYTVPTPGSRDRGARRIVSGGDPPEVLYYTDDHYRTFRRVEMNP